jgi:hypothetical protein
VWGGGRDAGRNSLEELQNVGSHARSRSIINTPGQPTDATLEQPTDATLEK